MLMVTKPEYNILNASRKIARIQTNAVLMDLWGPALVLESGKIAIPEYYMLPNDVLLQLEWDKSRLEISYKPEFSIYGFWSVLTIGNHVFFLLRIV